MNQTAPLLRTRDGLGEDELGSLRRTFGFAGHYDEIRTPGGDGVEVQDASQEEIDFHYSRFQNEGSEEVPPDESRTPRNSGHDRETRVYPTQPLVVSLAILAVRL